jgi:hypothetical protein
LGNGHTAVEGFAMKRLVSVFLLGSVFAAASALAAVDTSAPGRDPAQKIDEEYFGLTRGVSIARPEKLKLTGSIVRSKIVDRASPILYGYAQAPAVYSFDSPIFIVSKLAGGRAARRRGPDEKERPTGRGTAEDPDRPTGPAFAEPPEEPEAEAWEALPLTDEQKRNNPFVVPPAERSRVVLRYGDNKDLLVSGLLEGGKEIAQHPTVIDVPVEKGHVVLFSNNPIWRGETRATYFLVFNAILNFDHLDAGRKPPAE